MLVSGILSVNKNKVLQNETVLQHLALKNHLNDDLYSEGDMPHIFLNCIEK